MEGEASSPGTSMVELRDSMEELLKLILKSPIDLGFSHSFLHRSHSQITETPDPLYKRLASVLCEWIDSGGLDEDLKNKEEWNELVREKGLELQNILKTIDFELHVQEAFFTQLRVGFKTVEGRCAVGDYNRKFYSEEKEQQHDVLAIHVTKPASQLYIRLAQILSEMSCEGIERVLGGAHTSGTI